MFKKTINDDAQYYLSVSIAAYMTGTTPLFAGWAGPGTYETRYATVNGHKTVTAIKI